MAKPKTPTYDTSYKLLFSCPELVRDMLIGYVPGEWLAHADFNTLTRINASYVTRSNKQRHDDMVWRLDVGGQSLWVYILLEFQSEPYPWMAVRMMQYVSLLAEQIIKEDKLPSGRLPPVLPIVLYNGQTAWNAPVDVADCFHALPGEMKAYQPTLRYILIDELRLKQPAFGEAINLAGAAFAMEASDPDGVVSVVHALHKTLLAPETHPLREVFSQWIKALLMRRATDSMIEEIAAIKDIFEEIDMLTGNRETWFAKDIEKSFMQGMEKGMEKGREEALLSVARNMLHAGKPCADIAQATGLPLKTIQSLMH
ncbi:MAG: Rpn family recombination-promoting nuclease/putative transposase [Azoarcus sp.]|jgi:predicted transposase/invertase (TIGR01784 family)|nr:Rpn family recombination-promoting nuclease/putative transposase [Azoarcus sp.]